MSCEFCQKADFGDFSAKANGAYSRIHLAGGNFRFPKDEQFNFCPMCGEALTEPEPLTVEQLSCMHGEPVYIMEMESGVFTGGKWELLDDDKPVDFVWQEVRFKGNCYAACVCGETWLAYANKPREGTANA